MARIAVAEHWEAELGGLGRCKTLVEGADMSGDRPGRMDRRSRPKRVGTLKTHAQSPAQTRVRKAQRMPDWKGITPSCIAQEIVLHR